LLSFLLGVVCLGCPLSARAQTETPTSDRALSDSAELDRVVELYLSGQYERCADVLGPLLQPNESGAFVEPRVVEKGRLYLSSCALLSGHAEQARSALRAALEVNPLMPPPDSLTFPPPLLALFLEVREEVQSLISREEQEQVARLMRENAEARQRAVERALREKQLLELAIEQPIVVQSSRFVASLPFGAGQYQNGDATLGHTLLVSEVLLAATAATSAAILLDFYSQTGGTINSADKGKFEAAFTVMTISTYALLGTIGLGILEANLNFQEERRVGTKKRELPPTLRETAGPKLVPFTIPTSDGFRAGLSGSF